MRTSDLEWMAVGAADAKSPPPPPQQQQQEQEPEKTQRINSGKRKPGGSTVGGDGNCNRPRGGGDTGGAANVADRASVDSHEHNRSKRFPVGGGGRGSGCFEAGGSFPGMLIQGNKRGDASKQKKAGVGGKGRVTVGSQGDKSIRRRRARQRLPPSDLAKRVELLEAIVLWTFKDVIVPLVGLVAYHSFIFFGCIL